MDSKAILANKVKINELAVSHNKLTTLVACLLNEVNTLKKELNFARGGNAVEVNSQHTQLNNSHQNQPNLHELNAEDILKQLSINN